MESALLTVAYNSYVGSLRANCVDVLIVLARWAAGFGSA